MTRWFVLDALLINILGLDRTSIEKHDFNVVYPVATADMSRLNIRYATK